jgi:hypothetical protein
MPHEGLQQIAEYDKQTQNGQLRPLSPYKAQVCAAMQ